MLRSTLLAALALMLSHPAQAGLVGDALKAAKDKKSAAEAPAGAFWFNPAEILIFRGQLFYSAYANGLAAGQQLSVTLEGPGAPTAPLVRTTSTKDGADFSERWLSFSSGELGTNKQGLPIEGLSAGTYQLKMQVDGREVAAQEFSLIQVPTVLGATELQVDPRLRAWRPYLAGPYLLLWVPVDLTDGLPTVRGAFWTDGQYAGEDLGAPAVPRLHLGSSDLADEPIFQLSPVAMRLKAPTGTLDAALVYEDRRTLGVVHWVNAWDAPTAEGVTPRVRPGDGGSIAGMLRLTAPSPAQADKVSALLADVATRPRDPNFKAPRGLLEPQVCALHDSADARATYRNLLSLREEYGDAVWTTWNALQVKKDPGASAAERSAAEQAMSRGASNQAAYAARVKEVAARFDQQTAGYKAGCLDALRPEGFGLIQEPPGER